MAYTLFFINYKSSLETITSALVIFGIIISIFSVYDLLGIKSTLFQYTFLGRFSFLDLNPIYLARYISAAILGNLFWIIKLFKAKEKSSLAALLLVLVSLFELYILLLTASRGPILALLVACAAYTIIVGKFRIIKLLCAAAIVLLVVIFSTIIIPEAFLERILSVNPSGQITIVSRYLGNLAAIKNFWANKIFGIGFGSFIFKFGDIETMIYPHNIFTEIMAEGGFIGILLLLEIIVLTVFKYLINIKTSLNKHGFLVAFLLAAIINANLSGHIGKNFYFWVGLALIYAEYSRGKKIDEKNSDSNI